MVRRVPEFVSAQPPEGSAGGVRLPSGYADLDRALGGGWPAGVLAEVRGRGRSSLGLAAVRSAQARGVPCAWIDGSGGFCPATARVDLGALVLVRPRERAVGDGGPGVRGDLARMLFAADVLLRSRAFGLLVLDLPAGRRGPAAAWFRLARLTLRAEAPLLLLQGGASLVAGSAASLVLDVTLRPGAGPAWDELPPPRLSVHLRRHRGASGERRVDLPATSETDTPGHDRPSPTGPRAGRAPDAPSRRRG
ncbi:MAG: hypothetical protein H6825_10680 [Planctomycetes bacterium]|nr:hypothetical protein [Planctomycetota bacterium]